MKFIRTFKDSNNVYFLVEYVRGMELFDVIREIGKKKIFFKWNQIICVDFLWKIRFNFLFIGLLNTYDSQFYISSLLLCIEYLHTNSIIYRDIKPENIMIDYKVRIHNNTQGYMPHNLQWH